jgi:ABC-2 type transport system ATP-binding protein
MARGNDRSRGGSGAGGDGRLIEGDQLKVRRGSFTLDIADWHLDPGIVVGLVGPNGAGKTTFLETLAGLCPANGGAARVFGRDPWKDPSAVRSSLGFMSDNLPLFEMRTGPLLRMLSGYYPSWDSDLVESLLSRFHIDPTAKVRDLSKGEGTRIRLIVTMAFRPRVLLLDEPSSGLDLGGRRSLLESVLEVVRDPARSVMISSHMLHDVQRISDRLLVLNGGKVVREGPTDRLVGEEQTLEEALLAWGAAG